MLQKANKITPPLMPPDSGRPPVPVPAPQAVPRPPMTDYPSDQPQHPHWQPPPRNAGPPLPPARDAPAPPLPQQMPPQMQNSMPPQMQNSMPPMPQQSFGGDTDSTIYFQLNCKKFFFCY